MTQTKIMTVFLALLTAGFLLTGCTDEQAAPSETQPVTQSAQTDSSNIKIPGYEALDFKAGETEQDSRFHNPQNNACYFRLTLTLDGETLWQSDYIAPGEKVGKITLARSLGKGDYQAKLNYECFTLQDKSPLNGAEIDLAIHVN